jgi:molecular chaperone GrpE
VREKDESQKTGMAGKTGKGEKSAYKDSGVSDKTVEEKEPETVLEKMAEEPTAEEALIELNDRYLRLLAEYDNYRKRTEREKDELIKTASENLIMELLPILDNLDRATEHRNKKTTYEEYVKGIALIEDQFRAVLARVGLEPMEVVGKPFDPAIHDAVMQIETDEYESGIVTDEVEKGYMLSGKVIRHPKVIVSK